MLAYLAKNHVALIASFDSIPAQQAYMNQGSHPDVVERVWNVLAAALPEECRCLIYGTPALIHPQTGIVIAFCNGTTYCIRLTEVLIEKALQAKAPTYQKWSYGGDMDTQRDLGPTWIFGHWSKDEPMWCRMTYDDL